MEPHAYRDHILFFLITLDELFIRMQKGKDVCVLVAIFIGMLFGQLVCGDLFKDFTL